jgi:cyclin-dependent kinase 3
VLCKWGDWGTRNAILVDMVVFLCANGRALSILVCDNALLALFFLLGACTFPSLSVERMPLIEGNFSPSLFFSLPHVSEIFPTMTAVASVAPSSSRMSAPLSGREAALERYQRMDILGEGTYGVVYRAIDRTNGQIVALKKMRLDRTEEGIPQTALREVSILQEIHHINIVNLLDVICADGKLYLIFEFVDQDLKKALEKRAAPFNGNMLKRLIYQLLDGVYFCHRHRIIHRDLKPANILLTANGELKIADFGLARAFQVPMHTYTHEVVTMWYRAPEILLGEKRYTPAVDMWSVGCIFAELARGRVLFRGDSEIGQLFETFQVLGTPTAANWPGISQLPDYREGFPQWSGKSLSTILPDLDPAGIELLGMMLRYNPSERISAKEALRHPWFLDMRN